MKKLTKLFAFWRKFQEYYCKLEIIEVKLYRKNREYRVKGEISMKTLRKIAVLFILTDLINFGAQDIEGKIAQIRKDFSSTNAVKNYVIKEVEDSDQSTDSGVVKYYLQDGVVKKIVAEYFGESGNNLTEYYIKNGKVYFIFDKTEKYNVPYYVDSKWYKENEIKNGEIFDKRKSKFFEKRYYFDENEKLIRYIDENKKIVENGKKLREIEKDVLKEYFRIKK